MFNWFKSHVLFVSLNRYGLYVYIHFIPKYTVDLSFSIRRKNPFLCSHEYVAENEQSGAEA